jgi:P27 family predicted phage terminase small subunit
MKGRKKLPAKLHILRGNPGHRPINLKEPRPESGVPKRPKFLSQTARKYWNLHARQLDNAGILARIDVGILASCCTALAALDKAETMIEQHGYTQTTDSGERKSPWVMIAKESRDQVRNLGAELGLSPTSRAQIKVGGVTEKQDAFEVYRSLKPKRA